MKKGWLFSNSKTICGFLMEQWPVFSSFPNLDGYVFQVKFKKMSKSKCANCTSNIFYFIAH